MKADSKIPPWVWLLPPYIGVTAATLLLSAFDVSHATDVWIFLIGLLLIAPFTTVQYAISTKRVSLSSGLLFGVLGPITAWLLVIIAAAIIWRRPTSDWPFVERVTRFEFPAGTEYLAQYDNAEWFVVSVVRLPADSAPAFIQKYRFTAGADGDAVQSSALPDKYCRIPDHGVLSNSGGTEHQAWEAIFDPASRLLWIEINYPDWAGDHSGSAPQPIHPPTPKDEAEAPFFFSAGLKIENLTLEDYATLNRDMGEILKRVGFVGCKGYLITRPGIHEETNPVVFIEGKSKSNEVVKQMIEKEGIQSVADKLTLEFERSRNAQNKTADSSR